ncbi:MAG TPA: peptidase inhibitor I42 [Pseudomonas sp.]|jgi:inhibitor of cysteine peptidase|nr:peptidase inhibitor I42 [Pseudomonas sp.]
MSPTRLLFPLALALLAACTTQPAKNVTVEKQSACPAKLHNGQTLILSLPSNPTTGYRWAIQDSAGGVLRALSPEVYSNPQDAGVVGAAGISTWRFLAFANGTGRLRLTSQQPWAPEVLPVETFDCAISVN